MRGRVAVNEVDLTFGAAAVFGVELVGPGPLGLDLGDSHQVPDTDQHLRIAGEKQEHLSIAINRLGGSRR